MRTFHRFTLITAFAFAPACDGLGLDAAPETEAEAEPTPAIETAQAAMTTASSSSGPWAVVRDDGTLVRGGDAIASTQLSPGRYEVQFNKDLSDCGYTATIGDPANGLVYYPGLVFTAGGHTGNYHVYVETKNYGGGLQSFPFHLAVSCGSRSRWAVVDASGAKVRGGMVKSTTQLGIGRYEVEFKKDVSDCGYTATIGDPANQLVYYPGLVFTAGGHTSGHHVYVETKNPGGGLTDYPFHLAVSCGSSAPWAVVDGNGSKVRGGMVKSTTQLSIGRYEVQFKKDVSGCGYIATIGDPGNALVYNPGLVFTAGGHTSNHHVYVETKNPGGGLTDYPFHLAVSCGD